MPWKAQDIMSLREEFVLLARQENVSRHELCRRFGISPQTAYKWLTALWSKAVLDWSTDPEGR